MSGKNTAIILLHGVGDQIQRGTIQDFLHSLSRLNLAQPVVQQTVREPGTADAGFNYFWADVELKNKTVKVAEYYWADLSRIRVGFLNILRNYFQLIVDVPDIIYACLGPKTSDDKPKDYFVLRCLRMVLALTLWLIYFPVMALNFAYAVMVGAFAFKVWWTSELNLDEVADLTAFSSSAAAIIAIVILIRSGLLTPYFRALAMMTMLVLAAVCAVSTYNIFTPDSSLTFGQISKLFQIGLNSLWLIILTGSLIYLLLLPILLLFFIRRWRAILLGFATNFLVIRFWLFLITTIWLIFLTSVFDQQTYSNLIGDIKGPIRFLSLIWLDIAVVGIVLIVALAAYAIHTLSAGGEITGTPYPRLIIPASIPTLTVVLAFGGLAIIGLCNCSFVMPECRDLQCYIVDKPTEWIIAHAATFLAVGGLVVQFTHSGSEVALDIVNYFKSDRGHRRINVFSAMGSVFFYKPEGAVEFRPMLKARLEALLNDLGVQFGKFDRTIFIAHSLGSMIAVDVLRDLKSQGGNYGQLDLVTLGSPYSAIFNYYFPHMFGPASTNLLPDGATWFNLYSENDYVGTSLTDGKAGIKEKVELPFGHVHYLDNDVIVKVILQNLFNEHEVVGEEKLIKVE